MDGIGLWLSNTKHYAHLCGYFRRQRVCVNRTKWVNDHVELMSHLE